MKRRPGHARRRPQQRKLESDPQELVSEKLQKVLARAGLGSRRELEGWIADGRVSVNGRRAELGQRVLASDLVRVDGRALPRWRMGENPARVLRYHKPVGEVCTRRDPERRPTVFEQLPSARGGRWIVVGRLDVNTSGLLLFTNDGALANRLMHPRHGIVREYACRIFGEVTQEQMAMLRDGVMLDDGVARLLSIQSVGGEGRNHWYRVAVAEGRNRLVRRVWQALGVEVSRLTRVRFGPIELPRELRAGRFDVLDADALKALYAAVDLTPPRSRKA